MRKFAMVAERAAQIGTALAAFVFLLSGVVYLWVGHWPVTRLDFWEIYEFCLNHTWLESAVVKHGEHVLFFPSFFGWPISVFFMATSCRSSVPGSH